MMMDQLPQRTASEGPDCFVAPSDGAVREVLVVPEGEAAFDVLPESARAFVRDAGFAAKPGQIALVPGAQGVASALLTVAGGEIRDALRFAPLATGLPKGDWRVTRAGQHAQAVVDGWDDDLILGFAMGAYRIRRDAAPAVRLVAPVTNGVGHALAAACWLGRDLINRPANLLGPVELADIAVSVLADAGAHAESIGGDALATEYPCLAHVAAGSDRPGRVVRASWRGSGASDTAPHIALVGKGVCFDTGGYDIKPSSGMLRMKKDMGGAALMLALASAIIAQDLPVRLTIRIGCVENSISGHAMRPSDVVRTRSGQTVEIGNTDAEGRLVLCDLLDEVSSLAPDRIIDAATLTGAARVALGPDLPALFSNDALFAQAILGAAEHSSDDMWRLPLWHGYSSWLASNVADCGNVSAKPMAGAITAALFLEKFVKLQIPWAHVDTYAWNDSGRVGRPEGGETLGLRALYGAVLQTIKAWESSAT